MTRPLFRGRTYRQVAAEFIVCDGSACNRHYSKTTHLRGKADGMGHLHWSGIDKRMTKAGLHRLLVLMATVKLRHATRIHRTPHWQQIYEEEVWAYREALHRHHIRIPKSVTMAARHRAAHWALREKATVRTTNFAAYQWIYVTERKIHA